MTLSGVKVEEDCIMKLLPMFCKSLSNDDCIDTGNEIGLPPFTEPFNAPCEFLCDGQHKKKREFYEKQRSGTLKFDFTYPLHMFDLANVGDGVVSFGLGAVDSV